MDAYTNPTLVPNGVSPLAQFYMYHWWNTFGVIISMRTDILSRKEDILEWIKQHQSKAFMCKKLKCKQNTLNSYLSKMGIEYAGNQFGTGIKHDPKYKSAIEYIKSSCVKSQTLKDKLIRDGLKEDACECCGLTEWLGEKLTLELHHKNGDHYDNDLNNLAILCPNCHSIQASHKKSKSIYNNQ